MKNNEQKKERIRERYKGISEDNLDVIPAIPQDSFYDESKKKRVAVYARVSTDDPSQTSSYELQKNHYTDMVNKRDDWDLIDIYADEGISGTSLQHRDSFLRMIKDCEDGKIDLIVTKSVSRFARNVLDCIGYVRQLKAMKPPVGIYFETERIYTLSNNSEMSLSFIATLAQEESHNKSEIMNASIEMRFKRGIFLTPVLLGYDQDEEGNLIVNEEEAKVVRLIFFMYLYGYSTQDIAGLLSRLQCRTKKGNTRWNAGSVLQILKNERHCGDVRARKTFTPNYLDHKSKKNNRERNQYIEKNHHESIISRDDFIAVQHMITNAKYGSQKFLPYLNVVSEGVLKGFILVNIKWSGFKVKDYLEASETINKETDKDKSKIKNNLLNDGDFDLRGFEVTRIQFLSITKKISVSISINELFFSNEKVSRRDGINYIFNGQHTAEIIALVSGSRDTPVWCMIYDDLEYTHEAEIFANQMKHVKPLLPYEIFMAKIEAENDEQLIIKDLVESYGLSISSGKKPGGICAVTSLEKIYENHGFAVLDRTLRLIVGTWEGEDASLSSNMLLGVAKLITTYGDTLKDDMFKEKLGKISSKELSRNAKDRKAGSMGYAEAILLNYNKKQHTGLSIGQLYGRSKKRSEEENLGSLDSGEEGDS